MKEGRAEAICPERLEKKRIRKSIEREEKDEGQEDWVRALHLLSTKDRKDGEVKEGKWKKR